MTKEEMFEVILMGYTEGEPQLDFDIEELRNFCFDMWQARDAEIARLESENGKVRIELTHEIQEVRKLRQQIKELEEFQVHCPDCTNLVTVKELYDFDGMCEDCVLF